MVKSLVAGHRSTGNGDGDVVPRAALANRTLVGGERIEIVTFVGGG